MGRTTHGRLAVQTLRRAPLPPALRDRLSARVNRDGLRAVLGTLRGVGQRAVERALAGLAVEPATRELIRIALDASSPSDGAA